MLTVVGIGAGGWDDLAGSAQRALLGADVVVGSARQLDLVPASVPAVRELLPSPLHPGLAELLDRHARAAVAVLASGDPMFHGIGTTLVGLRGAERVTVLPHPSSVSLAAARLGWALDDVEVVSAVGRPLEVCVAAFAPGRRLLVLTTTRTAAGEVHGLLAAAGYTASAVTVLTRLGGPDETVSDAPAAEHDPLAVIAVACVADPGTVPLSRSAALPDDAYDSDGQLTKQEIRAFALASLAPLPGELLWDVGAGSGSIGIEWMRAHPRSQAIAIEPRDDRRARISTNARKLGVPGLQVVAGSAPGALTGLPTPDAVFVGGGVSAPGVVAAGVAALRPGGRLVADAVTLESETVLGYWYARLGGKLTRLSVQRAGPVGSFTGWRPAMPVTQWCWVKPEDAS